MKTVVRLVELELKNLTILKDQKVLKDLKELETHQKTLGPKELEEPETPEEPEEKLAKKKNVQIVEI